MAATLPYLSSNRNVDKLFSKVSSAKIPDKFTHEFLQQTIGLKGTNDRPLIPLLRALGYLDQSGTPTTKYGELKNATTAKASLASAIRRAYAPLFDADESAHKLPADRLKGLVAQVAGTDETMTARIVATFNALTKIADFSAPTPTKEDSKDKKPKDEKDQKAADSLQEGKPLRPEFHYNLQIHLPANATEEVYLNIFNALRKVFQ